MKKPGIVAGSGSASDLLCVLARSSSSPEHFFPWVPQPSCDFTFREWFCCCPLRAGEPWHAVGSEQIFASKLNSECWSNYGTLCPRHILGMRGQEEWAVAKCRRWPLPICIPRGRNFLQPLETRWGAPGHLGFATVQGFWLGSRLSLTPPSSHPLGWQTEAALFPLP